MRFRAGVDLLYMLVISGGPAFVVALAPSDKSLIYTGYLWIINAFVYLLLHILHFHFAIKRGEIPLPFESVADFLPDFKSGFDAERKILSRSFFGQGIVKHLLTEGEKLMFTWFSLMTLAQQGVYDVISNLGAIPARLFFAKLEESAHLYFSQTVARGRVTDWAKEEIPSKHLHLLLKGRDGHRGGMVGCTPII